MQPRGQLWFELQRMCEDFRNCSGLSDEEALQVLISVLGNLKADQETELARLRAPAPGAPSA